MKEENKLTNDAFIKLTEELFAETERNTVNLPSEGTEVRILEKPLIGFAAADDPLFRSLRAPEAVGEGFRMPEDYLSGAKTVVAFFFPFSGEIRSRHAASAEFVDEAWTNGYREAGALSGDILEKLQKKLEEEGIRSCRPERDPGNSTERLTVTENGHETFHFSVSWSTRHACFAAGLGTFGRHRHIITEKGCCGTLETLIIDAALTPTPRGYEGLYDYCSGCGKCAGRCPAGAIDPEGLRDIRLCAGQGDRIRQLGLKGSCGKCMVGVPCEAGIPEKPAAR